MEKLMIGVSYVEIPEYKIQVASYFLPLFCLDSI